ncbi:MAG TPA: hypothetical protein VF618_06910 [Thermoanaerobaculia bacterium]
MRHQRLVVLVLVALLCATSFSVTGQEDAPLPTVRPRDSVTPLLPEEPTFPLPVEPVRESVVFAESLAEAARRNDYAGFHQLYLEDPSPAFATLHEVWTYAMTNPVGAFYGEELHERLARAYPGYASFIEPHRLVDDRGQVFYPTAETRRYLTERAIAGVTPSSRVQIAENRTSTRLNPIVTRRSTPAPVVTREREITTTTPAPTTRASRKRLQKAEAVAPEAAAPVTAPAKPAPVMVAQAAPVVQSKPAAQQPAVPQLKAEPIQANVLAPAIPVPIETPGVENPMAGRGAFLIIIALAGIGMLMMMLRAPREAMPAIIQPEEKPAAPVQPIRKPKSAQKKASA